MTIACTHKRARVHDSHAISSVHASATQACLHEMVQHQPPPRLTSQNLLLTVCMSTTRTQAARVVRVPSPHVAEQGESEVTFQANGDGAEVVVVARRQKRFLAPPLQGVA